MREGTTGRKNFIKYLRKNLTRMLLFAVIVSTGFTMRLVTRTKYVSYVNGFQHAQAGDFYFTSNYLSERGNEYIITNWARDRFDLSIRIQNFENALLYNKEGQDFYYDVEAEIYTDAAYKTKDTNFNVKVSYGGKEEWPREFPGLNTFSKDTGIQTVDISFVSKNGTSVDADRYIKIKAKTRPVTSLSTKELISLTGPVYQEELSATIRLTVSEAKEITSTLKFSTDRSDVIYKLKCEDDTAGAAATVLVYYDPTVMELDDILPYKSEPSDKTGYEHFKMVKVPMLSSSIVNLIFFKHDMQTEIIDGMNGHIFFEKATK